MRYFKKFLKLAGFTQSNLTGQGKERLVFHHTHGYFFCFIHDSWIEFGFKPEDSKKQINFGGFPPVNKNELKCFIKFMGLQDYNFKLP